MRIIPLLISQVLISSQAFALPTFSPQIVLKNQQGEVSNNAILAGSNFVASFQSATVTLTTAQVLALNGTPIQLVAAQSGYLIQVVDAEMKYTKSTAFTVTSSKHLELQYHTSAVQIASISTTGFIDQSTSKTAFVQSTLSGGVSIGGEAVEITSDDSGMGAGTGSTVAVTVYYNLLKVL